MQCMYDYYNIVAHACIPQEGIFHTLPTFGGMSYFEIVHYPRYTDLFTRIEQK